MSAEENRRAQMQTRTWKTEFQTRSDENDNPVIEGYFAVFDKEYDMGRDWFTGVELYEKIERGAFAKAIREDDIRALINHDTTLVLGRNKANTLTLREDEHGLWGRIAINKNDTEAMNLYARVQRGDVSQCSFGFEITSEQSETRDNGDICWTIKEVKMYEVSPCTFPAYKETEISARCQQAAEIKKRSLEAWKNKMLKKLKGEKENGT